MNTDRFILRAWDKNGNPAQMYYYPFIVRPPAHLRLSEVMEELRKDGWVWMQCTGIKDKNGRLIFEGDFIKIFNWIGEVYWSEDRLQWWCEDHSLIDLNACEIVGNRFENPELLREAEQ